MEPDAVRMTIYWSPRRQERVGQNKIETSLLRQTCLLLTATERKGQADTHTKPMEHQ